MSYNFNDDKGGKPVGINQHIGRRPIAAFGNSDGDLQMPDIGKLQAEIIAAAKPFMLETGPIGAFTAPHDNPAYDAAMIKYVSTFERIAAGEHFNPHVSTGTAPTGYLDKMVAEPFETFTFSTAGAAIYQLGPFGTAAKKLKEWGLRHGRNSRRELPSGYTFRYRFLSTNRIRTDEFGYNRYRSRSADRAFTRRPTSCDAT